jgi:hypothetical protein
MAVTYNVNVQTINRVIASLLEGEFTQINVRCSPDFEFDQIGKFGVYIRYYYQGDTFLSRHTDGEMREFTYNISIYFNRMQYQKKDDLEDVYSDYSERLNTLLCADPTQWSSAFTGIFPIGFSESVWFDANMDRELVFGEDNDEIEGEENKNNIIEFKHEFRFTRGTTWS